MNILFACDEYPPAPTGGIGSATKTVAEALVKRGHNVYVVSGRLDKTLPEEDVINGVKVYRVYLMQKISWLFKNNFLSLNLHKIFIRSHLLAGYSFKEYQRKQEFIESLIKLKNIQVVELPDYNLLSKYYCYSKVKDYKPLSVSSIARVHGSVSFLKYYTDGFVSEISKNNDKKFFESVDKILSVSRFAADFVNKKLGVNTKCDVIYNPLVNTFIDFVNSRKEKRNNTIVFLGKIVETKGAFNLIKAFNQFTLKHPEFDLVMIGKGNIEYGKSIVNNVSKSKVLFTGYLKPEEISEYLRKAAFCVIPTFFENFSVAALEVMGSGNILIYSKSSSGPEVINDGVDGFLIDPYDVQSILEKMNYVAENLNSLSHIRTEAIKKIKLNFSEDIIIDQLEKYYKRLIKC